MSKLNVLTATLLLAGIAWSQSDRDIAARYAPVFYQALGDKPRSDYITNFDFDGDWRGDNNWRDAADKKYALRAYIYYAVSETKTSYFIHYAVFHPRDYKGGEKKGLILSDIIRQGSKIAGSKDPTGMLDEAAVAHENDLEGALVVVDKKSGRVTWTETLHHNRFSPYSSEIFRTDGDHLLLYVEPKGHGIEAYDGDEQQRGDKRFLIYSFAGRGDDPDKAKSNKIGYDLLPIETTLWLHAEMPKEKSTAFGLFHDYGEISIDLLQADGSVAAKKFKVGDIGSAFLGRSGGQNMAKPPWGWFDYNHRSEPLGLWFFDPATIIKRDFKLGDDFSTAYVRDPFWTKVSHGTKPAP